jgi:hypothetical protein
MRFAALGKARVYKQVLEDIWKVSFAAIGGEKVLWEGKG